MNCLALTGQVHGQSGSNIRSKKIAVQQAPVVVDRQAIVPGTFRLMGIDTSSYRLDASRSTLYWLVLPQADSVWASYRVFPFGYNQSLSRYRYDSVSNFFRAQPGARTAQTKTMDANRFLDWQGLNYTGSFGRSLSVGNTQDAVVNSLFNLQISGMLGDSIQISAAITDNNIPIQPDGTTQQLNEFDRVWLQFKKPSWTLNIGDIDVRQQPGYFMSFYKRQQGLSFETVNKLSSKVTNKTFVSGAIAKGKFTRNILSGVEGNQGPYRLQGANGELFFVVLAGTERVFIDGVQMQRGEDQDYVINYNTAEITFTPRQLINKDKRIQVEFEYADRNYLNSVLYAGTSFSFGKKAEVMLALYSNADAKNTPINQVLTVEQKQFLSELGDSIQYAYYPNAVRDSFDINKILYVVVDTIVDAKQYQVYRYQSIKDTAMYSLSFTDVGQGRGNYIILLNAANGTAYQWVAPVNNVPQGRYEPVARLVTPKQQQLITAGVKYNITPTTSLHAEGAYSVNDINTFSSKDKANDGGTGVKLQLQDNRSIGPASKGRRLQTQATYEFVDESFRPLERLRTVEFLRDWGLPFDAGYAKEKLPGFSIALSDTQRHQVQYSYSGYMRNEQYQGHRQQINHQFSKNGLVVNDFFQYTGIRGDGFDGYFLRPRISVNKTLKKLGGLETGAAYALEHNEIKSSAADTLLANSFSFTDWKAFVGNSAARRNRWTLQWFQRRNQFAGRDGFVPLDVNNNYTLQLELLKNPRHQVRLNSGFRTLEVKTAGLNTQQSDKTFVGRAEYFTNMAKGAVTGNLLYEAGAGQEQQRNYSYVEVPAGRGEYVWNDYNSDGVPQLNEFELAQFADQAKYIRLFTPTNNFVKSAYNSFNFSLALSPANIWRRDSSSFKRFMSKWNAQTTLQTSAKRLDDGSYFLNPFAGNVEDTALIYLNLNLANTLSYNRYSTSWGVDFTQVRNSAKALLTYGTETRRLNDYQLRIRKNISRSWVLQVNGKTGTNQLITPNPKFDNRNYDIQYWQVQPNVTYIQGTVFRMQLLYGWNKKDGMSSNIAQQSISNTLQLESKYNLVQKGVVTGKFTFSDISFNGPPNTTISFIMLDALQPGKNYLWSLDFTRRLANALELSFQYEGRKPGDKQVVHIGRAALRAIL